MGPGQSRERSARAAALWLLVIGFIASAMVSLAPASFLQARLRFGCRLSGVDWVCDDQAALLWPAIGGTVLGALALGGVALLIRATWDRARLRAEWLGSIALIGVLPTVVLSLLLLVDAIAHDASGVALDASRVAMWAERAMLSALASIVAGLLAASGLRMRARGRPRRVAFVALITALLLLLLSAAMSSLGTLPSGIVAASAIGAGWYIAAGAWPASAKRSAADVDPDRSRSTP
ncbi:putative membrane protein [Agrococcus sp. UYP33]